MTAEAGVARVAGRVEAKLKILIFREFPALRVCIVEFIS